MPGTRTSAGAASGETSIRRAPFCDSASTKPACGNVALRSSGLTWKRSETSTTGESRLGTWKVRAPPGVANTARLCAWCIQNPSSSTSSSRASRRPSIAPRSAPAVVSCSSASAARVLNAMRSRSPRSSGAVST
jgi:hypothetical protein